MDSRTFQTVSVEVESSVATVTVEGTGVGNALGFTFFEELPVLLDLLDEDDDVRVIVLRGAGEHFSYGLDLHDMREFLELLRPGADTRQRRRFLEDLRKFQDSFTRLTRARTPVIAAVDGWCIGGGVDLIAAADIRLATRRAKFSIRESRMGIVADLGSLQRLGPIIGEGNLRELALTGRDFDASYAHRIRLVTHVADDVSGLDQITATIATEIAQNSPLVSAGIKDVLHASQAAQIETGLRYVQAWNAAFLPSDDLREARDAFAARRPPHFLGR